MEPVVSIIMGSTSDMPVMEKAAQVLNEFRIPFEINALSAHRTPDEVEKFARSAAGRYGCSFTGSYSRNDPSSGDRRAN
jgi:5-(carboxyamino)imidazole ribonucleotide mutase